MEEMNLNGAELDQLTRCVTVVQSGRHSEEMLLPPRGDPVYCDRTRQSEQFDRILSRESQLRTVPLPTGKKWWLHSEETQLLIISFLLLLCDAHGRSGNKTLAVKIPVLFCCLARKKT